MRGISRGRKGIFLFNVLPLGISTEGYLFTKITRVPISYWRAQGKKVVMFLDDGISGCTGPDKASKLSTVVKEDLPQLGLI